MEITTFVFAGFVILTGIGYRWLPQRFKTLGLLFASSVFIVSWSWKFLIVLLLLAAINYFLGQHVLSVRQGRKVLWAGIFVNILALLVFKYNDFYLPALISVLARLGFHTQAGGLQLLEPLGLSFITVQMISYLVDVYYKRTQAARSFTRFAVYVIYFPKILAGPIERAGSFLSRLESPQTWTGESIQRNVALVGMGLIRKIILADTLSAAIPTDAFQKPSQYPAPLLALWLLAYAFALYNDFAGYSSIVRGVSGFLGIELTNNFNIPYFSRSFSEFWNRWHISLSNWLRDYIYFPLSRSLLKKIPDHDHVIHLIVPPMVTLLVSGLWHGVAWNTLLWGGLQGGFLVLERFVSLGKPRTSLDELPKWRQVLSALGVFFCVLIAWVPFHTGISATFRYWLGLIGITRWPTGIQNANTVPVLLFLFLALGLDIIQYKNEFRLLKWPGWLQAVLLILVAVILFLMSFAEKGAPFIYQGF